MNIEQMNDFFAARVDGYDLHMLETVEGCAQGYQELAKLLPASTVSLLDLGCGTGLELAPIFVRFPALEVTGIDLTASMLDALREKYPRKKLHLVCASYLGYDFGTEIFDAAISFQTLHHLTPEEKLSLYRRMFTAIRPGGCYIEDDYMVDTPQQEALLFEQCRRIHAEQSLQKDALYHIDTPCCIETQIGLLEQAGFYSSVGFCFAIPSINAFSSSSFGAIPTAQRTAPSRYIR